MSIQGWLNSRVLFKELTIRKMATFPRLMSSRLAMSTFSSPKAGEKPVHIANEKLMYVGDFVVHESYGIGKFAGSKHMKSQFFGKGLPVVNTYYIIKFADTDIFVESDQLKEKVFFFSPRDDPSVRIDTALSTKWEKKKRNFKSMNKRFQKQVFCFYLSLTIFIEWQQVLLILLLSAIITSVLPVFPMEKLTKYLKKHFLLLLRWISGDALK
jgi:hypothetical protein